jgi:hypothetical protein
MTFLRSFRASFVLCLAVCTVHAASAVTLDWDTAAWVNGSTNNWFDIDPSRPGNDVNVRLVGNNGATFASDITTNPQIQTPAVASVFQGGLAAMERTLVVGLNLTSNTQSVTLTLDFAAQYPAGIQDLTFRIFDVDYANANGNTYQDMLTNIRGLSADGVTWIAPTITTSSANTLTGTGLGQVVTGTASVVDTGAGSGNGNVTISFGSAAITRFEFTYGSGAAFANPTFQHVGFYDFSFTPVPEINPAWTAMITSFAAVGFVLHRRRAHVRK